MVGSTLWVCWVGLVFLHIFSTPAERRRVAEVDACREMADQENRIARFSANQGRGEMPRPQSAACESLENDLARDHREVFALVLGPPLLALVLFFGAQWIIQGL